METLRILLEKWKNGTMAEMFDEWRWILGYSKKYKKAICLYVFLGIFSTIFGLVSAIAGKQLIDIVTGIHTSEVLIIAVVMVVMAVFSVCLNSLISRISLKISIDIQNDIQVDIFQKIRNADWLNLAEYHSGDILNRFSNDVSVVASNAVTWLPNFIISSFQFAAVFCVIFYFDAIMAVISLASAPVLILVSRVLMKRMREHSKRVRQLNSEIMAFEQETFANMNTIKSFGITGRYLIGLKKWQGKYKDYNLAYNMFTIKANILLYLTGIVSQYGAFGWGIYRLWSGYITYGELMLFISQSSRLTSSFNSMISLVPTILNSSVAAGRIIELLNLPEEVVMEDENNEIGKLAEYGYTIRLKNVFFGYEENKSILSESDFEAHPNEIVALIGASGEGKTTLLRILLGLIYPDKGEAVIEDCNGNAVMLNAGIRKFFSYVPQGNTVFSGTIADNMRMVKEDASDEEIEEALKCACAWDFIKDIPGGIYAETGEHAKSLSEGQAQRIAIARAILRDAPVLLLDEATSALDINTERKVLDNIIKGRKNKTCIIATHRMGVLDMCQRIYRVNNKRIEMIDRKDAAADINDF